MPIEMYGSDDAGHLMLMPDPAPQPSPPAPPPDEPPLPGADAAPEAVAPVVAVPVTPPTHADELAALRRMIEARDQAQTASDARRDAQVETVTRVLAGQAPELPATPPSPPTRPEADAFETQTEYIEAVADWKAEEKLTAYRAQQAEREQTQQQAAWQRARDTQMAQAEAVFTQAHPDYQERVRTALAGKLAPHVHTALMMSDEGPAVAYALAQDPALVDRINRMPPPQLLMAIGRLSGQGGGGTPPAPAAPTPPEGPPGMTTPPVVLGRPKPTPPTPLSGTGVAPVGGYRDDMSMEEYKKWRAGTQR